MISWEVVKNLFSIAACLILLAPVLMIIKLKSINLLTEFLIFTGTCVTSLVSQAFLIGDLKKSDKLDKANKIFENELFPIIVIYIFNHQPNEYKACFLFLVTFANIVASIAYDIGWEFYLVIVVFTIFAANLRCLYKQPTHRHFDIRFAIASGIFAILGIIMYIFVSLPMMHIIMSMAMCFAIATHHKSFNRHRNEAPDANISNNQNDLPPSFQPSSLASPALDVLESKIIEI